MGRVIAMASAKGGVGKTTSVASVAVALTDLGYSVLVVDGDGQGDLTLSLGSHPDRIADEHTLALPLMAALSDEASPTVGDIAVPLTAFPGLSLAPSGPKLAVVVKEIEASPFGLTVFRDALGQPQFDFVLVDCPPTISLWVLSLLVAADEVLIPVGPDVRAFRGAFRVVDEVERIRSKGVNSQLVVRGAFLTAIDRVTNLSRDASVSMERFSDQGIEVLDSVPRSVRVSEAATEGIPVTRWRPDHAASQAYRSIAEAIAKPQAGAKTRRKSA